MLQTVYFLGRSPLKHTKVCLPPSENVVKDKEDDDCETPPFAEHCYIDLAKEHNLKKGQNVNLKTPIREKFRRIALDAVLRSGIRIGDAQEFLAIIEAESSCNYYNLTRGRKDESYGLIQYNLKNNEDRRTALRKKYPEGELVLFNPYINAQYGKGLRYTKERQVYSKKKKRLIWVGGRYNWSAWYPNKAHIKYMGGAARTLAWYRENVRQ